MKIGLALSGGGARGVAHLGVLKALNEFGIEPDMISGASAGGVVGSLYAAGYRPEEILGFITSKSFIWQFRPALKRGFINMESLQKVYLQYFPENSFEALKIPVVINATDINKGKTIYFSKGELIKPILASSSIPVMFEPVVFEGNTYVDAGILNNLPVEPLLGICDFIIGVHTNPYDTLQPLTSMRAVMERSLLLAVHTNVKECMQYCDIYVEPPLLNRFTTIDIGKAKEIFQVGYAYALTMREVFENALQAK
ncbi:MAG: patatin-like phospholipase family protein [Verrucomicrobia bacterium]|nr:patatin-like phospholipase family protein [Cytophagales bacterium]